MEKLCVSLHKIDFLKKYVPPPPLCHVQPLQMRLAELMMITEQLNEGAC